MLKVPPITSSLIIHTELNQEVDMQRYIFLITYDVLVSGKMAGYYMMSMMVTCITCFNQLLMIFYELQPEIYDLDDGSFAKGASDL